MFVIAQSGTRIDQEVLTSPIRRSWKESHNGRTGRQNTRNTSHRKEVIELATKVTMDLIEQHLIQPTKFHTMIQEFMATFSKDMQTLKDNMTMHTTALEELAYHRVMSLYDQLEIWKTYVRDKRP
jgi:hypothetical protein